MSVLILVSVSKRHITSRVEVEFGGMLDYSKFTKLGPGLDSTASLQEDGTINIWVKLKQAVPELPQDYAQSVEEVDVDPAHAAQCPPLSIVIFIVGSRGERESRKTKVTRFAHKE